MIQLSAKTFNLFLQKNQFSAKKIQFSAEKNQSKKIDIVPEEFNLVPKRISLMLKNSSDSNGIQSRNHLVFKGTLNHSAKLGSFTKWSSVRLRTKWLWFQIPLLSLKIHVCFDQGVS